MRQLCGPVGMVCPRPTSKAIILLPLRGAPGERTPKHSGVQELDQMKALPVRVRLTDNLVDVAVEDRVFDP